MAKPTIKVTRKPAPKKLRADELKKALARADTRYASVFRRLAK